jgi:hypothetical protein
MNKILFISLISMVISSMQAMNSQIIEQDKVTLLVGEEGDILEIQIPMCYARLSKTLRDCLVDCADNSAFIPVPLPRDVGAIIIEQLESLHKYVHQGQSRALSSVKDTFKTVESTTLVLIVRALDYLDIPLLTKIACEEVFKRIPDTIASYSVASLPNRIRCKVLRHHLVQFLGLTYVGSLVAHSSDNDEYDFEESKPVVITDFEMFRAHMKGDCSMKVIDDCKVVAESWDCTVRVLDMQGNQLAICSRAHEVEDEFSGWSVFFTNDNEIVTGSKDCTIRVWDMSGNQLVVCRGHEERVASVYVTANNEIVSGSDDRTIRVWDMQGNQRAICSGHDDWVTSLCVTADNKIVSGSNDCTIRVWDMQGNQRAICRGHEEGVSSVCVTADNKIVSGSYDKRVMVWDIQGNQLSVCKGHEESVWSLCVTADNKIVSGSEDKTVRLWNMSGNQLAVFRGHKDGVNSVRVTLDNKIASASYDQTVRIWDTDKLSLLEKAMSVFSASLEKSAIMWERIKNYYAAPQDAQNFSQELKALIS